jgi:hypothetical protein
MSARKDVHRIAISQAARTENKGLKGSTGEPLFGSGSFSLAGLKFPLAGILAIKTSA